MRSASLFGAACVLVSLDLAGDDDAGTFREALAPLLEEAGPALADVGLTAQTTKAAKIGGEGDA